VKSVIGDDVQAAIPIHEMTAELLRSFHAFFLIPEPARAEVEGCGVVWTKLLHERCVVLATAEDTAVACALLVGIQEGKLRDADAIGKQLQDQLGRTGQERDRVVRAVAPFAQAIAKGEIAPPEECGARTDDPGLRG
jgi:hypothetical protein